MLDCCATGLKPIDRTGIMSLPKRKAVLQPVAMKKEDRRRAGEGERTPSRAVIEEDRRSRILKKMHSIIETISVIDNRHLTNNLPNAICFTLSSRSKSHCCKLK